MLSTIRHAEIFNATEFQRVPITIIGAGATGSKVFMALVELGLTNITVFDFDQVESHNLANQAYMNQHIGLDKVAALKELVNLKVGSDAPDSMHFIAEALPSENHAPEGIVFLLTDTVESRKAIFEHCLKGNEKVVHVIETRMASSYGNVFQFDPHFEMQYEAWLNTLPENDDNAEVSACGSSISVGPTSSIIANMAVWQFILYLRDINATDNIVNVYLHPLVCSTEKYNHDNFS